MEESYQKDAQREPAGEDRAAYRETLLEMAGGSMMKFEARARRVFRHGPTATMVRQLFFWDGKKCADPEGYVYISYQQWWDEEGLSRTELDTARRRLGDGDKGCGVLEEKKTGRAPCTVHYRLRLQRLFEVMRPELDPPTAEDPVPEDLNPGFSLQGYDKPVCGVSTNQFAGFAPTHDREYAEDNSDISPRGAGAPQGEGEGSRAGSGPDPAKTNVMAAAGEDRARPLANEAMRGLVSGLEKDGLLLDEDQRQKYGKNLKALVSKGVGADELERVVARIVSEWSRIQLSPQQALSDLRGDRDAAKPSPPEVVEAIRRDDYFGESGPVKQAELWKVAERFDFAGDDDPPMKVRLEMTQSKQECDDWLRRLRSIARRAVREAQGWGDRVPAVEDAAARIDSKGLEDGPEGYDTPTDRGDAHDGQGRALPEALDRIADDPDGHIANLARAVVRFPDGSITREHVAEAVAEEVDLEALGFGGDLGPTGAGALAAMIIRRVRDRLEDKSAGEAVAM